MTLSDLEKYRANCELLECIDRQLGKKKVLISTQGSAGPPAYQLVTKKDEGYIHGLGTVSLLNEKSRIEAENEKICAFIDAIPVRRFHKALKLYCIGCGSKTFTWDEVAGMCDCYDPENQDRLKEMEEWCESEVKDNGKLQVNEDG